jgi:hypothetical protein
MIVLSSIGASCFNVSYFIKLHILFVCLIEENQGGLVKFVKMFLENCSINRIGILTIHDAKLTDEVAIFLSQGQ